MESRSVIRSDGREDDEEHCLGGEGHTHRRLSRDEGRADVQRESLPLGNPVLLKKNKLLHTLEQLFSIKLLGRIIKVKKK